MADNNTPLTEFTDRELLQLMVISLVELEKRNARLEGFIEQKFGKDFSEFSPLENTDITKTLIGYHDDAMSGMESN